ncbi:hypothetical protein N2152v2_010759 [Parachlorella kessleri]
MLHAPPSRHRNSHSRHLNQGPDALVGEIPGESPHSLRLRELAQACYDAKECLVCTTSCGDIVLVPRAPRVACEDGFAFLVFATNIKAAEVCDIIRHQQKALVVLDLDNTLVDASAVAVTQKDWDALHWQPCTVTTESGQDLPAQYAALMEHDPHAEATYIMHWRLGRLCCTFKVCIRRGWERLREFLVRERERYEVFVCSKGKQEYVQLLWHMLDPLSQLFPTTDWDWRLNSTFPDTVPRAVPKTMLTALGCTHPLDEAPTTQLACPVMCLDDCPKAYLEEYHNNVMYVEEYRPSDLFTSDSGSVLRQAQLRLEDFWAANFAQPAGQDSGEEGGPWTRAVDGVVEIMHDMLGEPLRKPEDLREHDERCAVLGEWLRERSSVAGVFGQGAYLADMPEVCSPTTPPAEEPAEALAIAVDSDGSTAEPSSPGVVHVVAEHLGEAAAAAEGPEGTAVWVAAEPEAPLSDVSNTDVGAATAGKRKQSMPETPRPGTPLCALCKPSGACLPGCPACEELAAAGDKGLQQQEVFAQADGERRAAGERDDYDVISTDGWNSPASVCSTPRSGKRGMAVDGAGPEGLRSGYESEEEREAASADVFQCVEPSLQQAARDVFHMRLARLSGNTAHGALLLVPNARSISGLLPMDGNSFLPSPPGSPK